LFISLHGGGGCPAIVNDQQYVNQQTLYENTVKDLEESVIYIAPRGPTNNWNLWHEGHVDPMLQELILTMVCHKNADPNRVYLMGYSAGGDGVYQLAPRMCYFLGAASMMAGHPNNSKIEPLNNIPFAIHCGELDDPYNRCKIAGEWLSKLDELEKNDDCGGYVHSGRLHQGKHHWMNKEDAEAIPWMMQHKRQVFPKKIVFKQAGIKYHDAYWVSFENAVAENKTITITREKNLIMVQDYPEQREAHFGQITLWLTSQEGDNKLDLNEDEVTVMGMSGTQYFKGKVEMKMENLIESMMKNKDYDRSFPGKITFSLPEPVMSVVTE